MKMGSGTPRKKNQIFLKNEKKRLQNTPRFVISNPSKSILLFQCGPIRPTFWLRTQGYISVDLYTGPPLMGLWAEEIGVFL